MTRRKREDGYQVGFGKPPLEHRFKKGKSGNALGRPKGAKNNSVRINVTNERHKAIILEEAYRVITISTPQGPEKLTVMQAAMRSIAIEAARGNHQAQRQLTDLVGSIEAEKKAEATQLLRHALHYKSAWSEELTRRRRLKITNLPDPLPHPDHVQVDLASGTGYFSGPWNEEMMPDWEMHAKNKLGIRFELALLQLQINGAEGEEKEMLGRAYEIGLALLAYPVSELQGPSAEKPELFDVIDDDLELAAALQQFREDLSDVNCAYRERTLRAIDILEILIEQNSSYRFVSAWERAKRSWPGAER